MGPGRTDWQVTVHLSLPPGPGSSRHLRNGRRAWAVLENSSQFALSTARRKWYRVPQGGRGRLAARPDWQLAAGTRTQCPCASRACGRGRRPTLSRRACRPRLAVTLRFVWHRSGRWHCSLMVSAPVLLPCPPLLVGDGRTPTWKGGEEESCRACALGVPGAETRSSGAWGLGWVGESWPKIMRSAREGFVSAYVPCVG